MAVKIPETRCNNIHFKVVYIRWCVLSHNNRIMQTIKVENALPVWNWNHLIDRQNFAFYLKWNRTISDTGYRVVFFVIESEKIIYILINFHSRILFLWLIQISYSWFGSISVAGNLITGVTALFYYRVGVEENATSMKILGYSFTPKIPIILNAIRNVKTQPVRVLFNKK